MAKYTLNSSDDELDFALTGITCAEEQYTATALIDLALGIQLQLSDYIPLALKDTKLFSFSLYRYYDEAMGLEYNFIPNLSNFDPPNAAKESNDLFSTVEVEERVRLIKELPKTDYFLLLKGEDILNYQFRIVEKLRATAGILQVSTIEAQELPSKRNLIF
jgi:hypothetical protein